MRFYLSIIWSQLKFVVIVCRFIKFFFIEMDLAFCCDIRSFFMLNNNLMCTASVLSENTYTLNKNCS